MRFENLGYDFGFFYQALQNIELGEYERIAFVNDSNEVVRLGSFNDIFEWANQEENELWGVTDADLNANGMLGRKYHIQSHFLVFEKKGIELLSSFFEDINFEEDYLVSPKGLRNRIIKNCEIGLTQYFLKNGLKAKSYFSVNDAKCPNPMFLNCQLNVHVSKWKELVDSGYPLIKRKIISGYYSGALNNWKKHRDYLDNPNFLNVATPCSRPENLLKMATSIKENLDKNYCWHIVFDEKIFNSDRFNSAEFEDVKNKIKSMLPDTLFYRNKSSGKAGHCHRNYILDIIEKSKGWIYFNDDDNIMSEDFRSIQGQLDLSYPVVVLSQKNHDGKIRCVYRTLLIASPENMKVHKVDTAQLIYNLDYIDGQRFEEDYNEADGMFAEEFYNKHKKALFLKDKFCYYNFLRPY
jgi:hypothetical protein